MKIGSSELLTTTPAAAHTSANGSVDPSSNFAALLQQQQVRATMVAPPPAPVSPMQARPNPTTGQASGEEPDPAASEGAASSSEAADDAPPSDSAPQTRPVARPRTRVNNNETPAANHASRDAPSTGSADSARAEATTARERAADTPSTSTNDAKTTTADGSTLPNWLAGLLPSAAQSTGAAAGTDSRGDAATELGLTDAPNAGAGRGRGLSLATNRKAGAHDALAAGAELEAAATASKDSAAATSNFTTLLAEQSRAEPAGPRGDADGHARTDAAATLPNAATAASTPMTTGTTATDAGSTSAAHVRAAVGSPEFPQELGVQLSVLTRDGVQQAELHLNPAEMGPVSVQIVMDGTQARIDFGADVAATRQAIEAGLPELASALRDAGFTLAGGGVSQHAGGRQGSDGDTSRRDGNGGTRRIGGSVADDAGSTAARVVRTRVSAGGVDLYA